MAHNLALVIDHSWEILYPPPADWQQHANTPRAQWLLSIRQQLAAISAQPFDKILTAAPNNNHLITPLFSDHCILTPTQIAQSQQPGQYQYAQWQLTPTPQSQHPKLALYQRLMNFKILSAKFINPATKTKPASPVPNAIPISTHHGLVNANAANDSIIRMLTNTKHAISHLVIVDPHKHILNTRSHHPNIPGLHNEPWTAYYYYHQATHPYPMTIIT